MRSFYRIALLVTPLFLSAQATPQPVSPPQPIEVHVIGDSKGSPWRTPETLLGALGILGGIAGMLIQRYWQRQDEAGARRETERGQLLDSLKWFEGKAQKRSIGISVIEGNFDRFPELHTTWVAILTNQAVYLLTESHQDDAAHELSNLDRILSLLLRAKITEAQYSVLSNAIELNGGGKQGLRLDTQKLKTWQSKLASIVGTTSSASAGAGSGG